MEERIQEQLALYGLTDTYEVGRIPYYRSVCWYTPDFVLPNGIIIEAKGYFKPSDRSKHLILKSCKPPLDIRFVFENPRNRLSKRSKTTYGEWADKHGFLYAEKYIPAAWLKEKPDKKKIAALKEVIQWKETSLK